MDTKQCTKCSKIKSLEKFHRHKLGKYGRDSRCKECIRRIQHERKQERQKYQQQWYLDNKDRLRPIRQQWYQEHKDECKQKQAEWYQANKQHCRAQQQQWEIKNRDLRRRKHQEYYQQNKATIQKTQKQRRSTDTQYRIACNLRTRLSTALRQQYKGGSAVKDLGCTISEFTVYLEQQFDDDMNWDNYGRAGWHIDHIIPLKYFNLGDPMQLQKACHYTNLQPLWAKQNMQKGAKMGGRILFRISADGDVHMDVEGIEDASCEQLTAAFEEALGGEVVEVQRKPEYYTILDGLEAHVHEEE